MRCTACGSETLVEGKIQAGDGSYPAFYPTETALLKRMFGVGGREITAYGCIRCHHVQLMVNFRDEDRERYAEFEGEQPSVLERLNTAPKGRKDG